MSDLFPRLPFPGHERSHGLKTTTLVYMYSIYICINISCIWGRPPQQIHKRLAVSGDDAIVMLLLSLLMMLMMLTLLLICFVVVVAGVDVVVDVDVVIAMFIMSFLLQKVVTYCPLAAPKKHIKFTKRMQG